LKQDVPRVQLRVSQKGKPPLVIAPRTSSRPFDVGETDLPKPFLDVKLWSGSQLLYSSVPGPDVFPLFPERVFSRRAPGGKWPFSRQHVCSFFDCPSPCFHQMHRGLFSTSPGAYLRLFLLFLCFAQTPMHTSTFSRLPPQKRALSPALPYRSPSEPSDREQSESIPSSEPF